MRVSLFILFSLAVIGLLIYIMLSGFLLAIAICFYLVMIIITISYNDTMVLFLLGGRELRSSDEKELFESASQEAYKLIVPMPRLYFYHGALERAFVLQNGKNISLVLSKSLVDNCTTEELKAISFELLLQVKKKLAVKRTNSIFVLGIISSIIHAFVNMILVLVPYKDFKRAIHWSLNFFFNPIREFLFSIILGQSYYKKLGSYISEYPEEKEQLNRLGFKLRRQNSYHSLSSRKLLELSSIYKSQHYQNIMAIEFLPHEWDYLFRDEELKRAE